jgi:hypothetical protein
MAVGTEDGVLGDLRRYGLSGADAELFPTLDVALAAIVGRSGAPAPATAPPAGTSP